MLVIITKIDSQIIQKSQSNHDKYFIFDTMVNNYGYKYIEPNILIQNKKNLKQFFLNEYGELPQYLISFSDFNTLCDIYLEIFDYCKLVVILCDIHHGKSIKNYRKPVIEKATYVLNNYGYLFEKYFPKHKGNIFFPHSIAYKINFNHNPIQKILVSGHSNKEIYPNRHIMIEKSKQNNNIYYHSPDYSGYRISDSDSNKTFGKKYYNLLNKYLCCFTDDANDNRPYIVAKFFEIMGTGSLLLACNKNTKNEFSNLGFIDGVHYISCDTDNIDDKIKFILNSENKDEINKIRYNGYLLVNQKHDYIYRAHEINKLLNNESIISEYKTSYDTNYKIIN